MDFVEYFFKAFFGELIHKMPLQLPFVISCAALCAFDKRTH